MQQGYVLELFQFVDLDYEIVLFFLQLTPNGEPDLKALYDEELAVAKDAISNLRSSFR